MILFFDTETTGFFQRRLPLEHSDQPGLVQIAGLFCHDDGKEAAKFSLIVNPDRPIPTTASDVHGISDDVAANFGVPEKTALGIFQFYAGRSDLVVAHNIEFDLGVMSCVSSRLSATAQNFREFCTMKAAAPIVGLPPTERMIAAGMTGPKSPKLEECVRHFFDEDLDGAHDAFVDVEACARVFFHLKEVDDA